MGNNQIISYLNDSMMMSYYQQLSASNQCGISLPWYVSVALGLWIVYVVISLSINYFKK